MRVLGIDPSLKATGYGIIESSEGNKYSVITYGTIKPSPSLPFFQRVNEIKTRTQELIKTFEPKETAIENMFYAQNMKTAITLGQVRGAVLVAIAECHCDLYEYSALEIKKAVTGYGQSDKGQVQQMVKTLLNLNEDKLEFDASDALATAYCHLNTKIFLEKIK